MKIFFFISEGVFLQSRRDGRIIEKQMIVAEPRRGERIIDTASKNIKARLK
jgi:signal recognition particle subunit SEC65